MQKTQLYKIKIPVNLDEESIIDACAGTGFDFQEKCNDYYNFLRIQKGADILHLTKKIKMLHTSITTHNLFVKF